MLLERKHVSGFEQVLKEIDFSQELIDTAFEKYVIHKRNSKYTKTTYLIGRGKVFLRIGMFS